MTAPPPSLTSIALAVLVPAKACSLPGAGPRSGGRRSGRRWRCTVCSARGGPSGYSSLTYLQRFPIDEFKIDQSFVRGLGAHRGDDAIVTSCVQLAHALGLRAVAEGVETPAQRAPLLDLACDSVQGYLFARPLPPDEFQDWFNAHPTT